MTSGLACLSASSPCGPDLHRDSARRSHSTHGHRAQVDHSRIRAGSRGRHQARLRRLAAGVVGPAAARVFRFRSPGTGPRHGKVGEREPTPRRCLAPSAGPMVRILFPPGQSPVRTSSNELSSGVDRRWAMRRALYRSRSVGAVSLSCTRTVGRSLTRHVKPYLSGEMRTRLQDSWPRTYKMDI
jgi:hypothetical protein